MEETPHWMLRLPQQIRQRRDKRQITFSHPLGVTGVDAKEISTCRELASRGASA